MNETPIDTKSEIKFFINEIAEREYPPVFVVEDDSPQHRFLEKLYSRDISEEYRQELALQEGIISIDCWIVLNYLSEEMDSIDKRNLQREVRLISAAKKVVKDDSPESIKAEIEIEDDLRTSNGLPKWLRDDITLFTISPTLRVLKFAEENGYLTEPPS
jgi:hypothetical protein